MIQSSLRINQLSSAGLDWLSRYLSEIEARNLDGAVGCNDGSTEVIQCSYLVDLDETGLIRSARVYGNGSRVFKPFMRAND